METTLSAAPLQEQIQSALRTSHHLSAERLNIQANDGHVRLAGTVGSYFQEADGPRIGSTSRRGSSVWKTSLK